MQPRMRSHRPRIIGWPTTSPPSAIDRISLMVPQEIAAAAVVLITALSGLAVTACGHARPDSASASRQGPAIIPHYRGSPAPHSRSADGDMLAIAAGNYIAGSTEDERERAYLDYRRTAGHDGARRHRWFAREQPRRSAYLGAFVIDRHLVTNAAYGEFLRDTGTPIPTMDAQTWARQGFIQPYDPQVVRFRWHSAAAPPAGREDHPVVLVTWQQADGYCRWRGNLTQRTRRLPTAAEYEKAARGPAGSIYPWGPHYDPDRLNSQVAGPIDTTPVDGYPQGASGYGMLDAAGNVFQWTATPWPYGGGGRMTVKGSAWDDWAGLGRGASGHGRRAWVRHVLVGFRCAGSDPARSDADSGPRP